MPRITRPRQNSLTLRVVPQEVRKELLLEQGKLKKKCNCQISLEQTAYNIIKKWGRIKGFRVNGITVSQMAEELK
jgi:hypothetical protein